MTTSSTDLLHLGGVWELDYCQTDWLTACSVKIVITFPPQAG